MLSPAGDDPAEGDEARAALATLVRSAEVVGVQSAGDAARLRALVGGHRAFEPVVLAPPLAWAATRGGPGHQLAWEVAPLLAPGRAVVRQMRPDRVVLAARHPRFGPFGPREVELLADLAAAFRRAGVPIQIIALGAAEEDAVVPALRRTAIGARPRNLEFVTWPAYLELVKWMTATAAFFDPADATASAQEDAVDRALLAGRPMVTLGAAGERDDLVTRLDASATLQEVVERLMPAAFAPEIPRSRIAPLARRDAARQAAALLEALSRARAGSPRPGARA